MKYLVEEASGLLKAGFQPPLPSSIAGHYVMDVPDSLGIVPVNEVVSNLQAQKLQGFLNDHPNLTNSDYDEMLDSSRIDVTGPPITEGIRTGYNKRIAIFPGGHLHTTVFTMTNSFSQYFLRYVLFFTGKQSPDASGDYPEPMKVLYGWDESSSSFADPDPADMQVAITDASTSGLYDSLIPSDTVRNLGGSGLSVRLRFTNVGTKTIYLSEWYMLWG